LGISCPAEGQWQGLSHIDHLVSPSVHTRPAGRNPGRTARTLLQRRGKVGTRPTSPEETPLGDVVYTVAILRRTHISRILDALNAAAPVTYRLLMPPSWAPIGIAKLYEWTKRKMFENCRNQMKFCRNSGGLAGLRTVIVSPPNRAQYADRYRIKENYRDFAAALAGVPSRLFRPERQCRPKRAASSPPCFRHSF